MEGKLDTLARQTGHSHASENETSIVMAAYPDRVRFVTLEEYDQAGLNYESDMPPKVWEYLEPFDSQRTTNPENPRDRARQEQALLATAEKGEKLIAIGTRYIADRLQRMIQATDAGTPLALARLSHRVAGYIVQRQFVLSTRSPETKKKELSTKGHEERRRATKALRSAATGCQGREGMIDF